jgi:hypothetical protein
MRLVGVHDDFAFLHGPTWRKALHRDWLHVERMVGRQTMDEQFMESDLALLADYFLMGVSFLINDLSHRIF